MPQGGGEGTVGLLIHGFVRRLCTMPVFWITFYGLRYLSLKTDSDAGEQGMEERRMSSPFPKARLRSMCSAMYLLDWEGVVDGGVWVEFGC